MDNEILQSDQRLKPNLAEQAEGFSGRLNDPQIKLLCQQRKASLELIKKDISLKFYYAAEEKLQNEEKKLQKILDWQEGKLTKLSKFSLILDTHFFEQEFLN